MDRYRPAGRRPAARQLSRTSAVRSARSRSSCHNCPSHSGGTSCRPWVFAAGAHLGPLSLVVIRHQSSGQERQLVAKPGELRFHSAGTVRGAEAGRSRGSGAGAGASGEVSRAKFALSRADECFLGSSRESGEIPTRLSANRAEPPATPREAHDRSTGASGRTAPPSLEAQNTFL